MAVVIVSDLLESVGDLLNGELAVLVGVESVEPDGDVIEGNVQLHGVVKELLGLFLVKEAILVHVVVVKNPLGIGFELVIIILLLVVMLLGDGLVGSIDGLVGGK